MRLTYKETSCGFDFYKLKPDVGEDAKAQKWNYYDALNKLGQLEDAEEELGIDLVTLFKALKNGIWYRLQNGKLRYMQVALALIPEGWVLAEFYPKATNVAIQLYNPMHKYGVMWALTKEELE